MRVFLNRKRLPQEGSCSVVLMGLGLVALMALVALIAPTALAQGPTYDGPQTQPTGPAYFGPAPNPVAYCESPSYFDPFPQNAFPVGPLNPGPGPEASVTTDGITMDLDITAEGTPGDQYPGFFPFAGQGDANDQPKGVEMQAGDAATITLSEPLFYSQWVFTDVDQPDEGFFVSPTWTDPDADIVVFGGDPSFGFSGNSGQVLFNDTNSVAAESEELQGRVQVDMLGAVNGISILRDAGNGQSGFAVGGGCEAAGASKILSSGPDWDGTSYNVTFELRLRNNLPSATTLANAIAAAELGAASSFKTGDPSGIDLSNIQFSDPLGDVAFSDIEVVSLTSPDGLLPVNPGYNGVGNNQLLAPSAVLAAESEALIELQLRYTPDLSQAAWADCAVGFLYSNQATVSGTAANVPFSDQSDNGINPAPGNDNGFGGVDDATTVVFPCPSSDLQIVKTVVAGPGGVCPTFANGVPGDGAPLAVTDQDTVTYCLSIINQETYPASNVVIRDPQNPDGPILIGNLDGGEERTISYDIQVDLDLPTRNTGTADGTGPGDPALGPSVGALGPVSDDALITVEPLPEPVLEIVKTVLPGDDAACPDFEDGVAGPGTALAVTERETVTFCVSVRNTGLGPATNVVLTDSQAPAGFGAVGELAPGETLTLSYDVVTTLATPATNTVTATGDGPYGAVDPADDDAVIAIGELVPPTLEIVKTALPGPSADCPAFSDGTAGTGAAVGAQYGSTVTYCISITNSGGTPATDVVISDPQAPASFDGDIGDLAIGQEVTRSYDLVVDDQTPATNVAEVEGSWIDGPLAAVQDDALIDPSARPAPVLKIVKTALEGPDALCPTISGGTDGLGPVVPFFYDDIVTYCLSVTNLSGSDATDVVVTDTQAPAGFDGTIGDLAVGEEKTVSFDLVVDASTALENTATVQGAGPDGPAVSDTDDARIGTQPQPDPVLEIRKAAKLGPDAVCPSFVDSQPGIGAAVPITIGEIATFCLTIRNSGLRDATDVVVSDAQAPVDFDGNVGVLAVGEERTLSYDILVEESTPEVNVGRVDGVGPNGPLPPATDESLIDSTPAPLPSLDIIKTVVKGPNGDCPDYDNGIVGVGPALGVTYGETVTYCLTAANLGAADAANVLIRDIQAPATFDGNVGSLAVDSDVTLSFDLVVSATTPEVNTALVSGTTQDGQFVDGDSDVAAIASSPFPRPELSIVKTVLVGPQAQCPSFEDGVDDVGAALPVTFGDTVTYCISVTNTGSGGAIDVVVTDAQAPDLDGDIGSLAINQEVTLSYDLLIDPTTPQVNTAFVGGSAEDGTPADGDSDVAAISSDPQAVPILAIVKTALLGPEADCPGFDDGVDGIGPAVDVTIGDTVTYCITIRNDGDGAATDVVISDDQMPAPVEVGVLNPAQVVTTSYDIVVDEDTTVVNKAMVSGVGPDGPVGAQDRAQINPLDRLVPSIELTNTVIPIDGVCSDSVESVDELVVGPVGDQVRWCFEIFNSGNTSLTDVKFDDSPLGLIAVDALTDYGNGGLSLPPLGSISFAATGTIPEGGIDSIASVIAVPSDALGTPLAGLDSVQDQNDASALDTGMGLDKRVVPDSGSCDDAVDELSVNGGSSVTWCFTVTNTGSVDLLVTTVTDATLAISIDLDAADQLIAPGNSVTVTATSTVDSDVENVAQAIGVPVDENGNPYPGDPLIAEDTAKVDTLYADLELTKSSDATGDVGPGQQVTYTITVKNLGPDPAEDVVVSDNLPDGLSYTILPDVAGWACTAPTGDGDGLMLCAAAEPLAVDEVVELVFVATVSDSVDNAVDLVNQAEVTSSTPDPDPTNNIDDETITTDALPPYIPPIFPDPEITPEPEPEPDEVLELVITGSSSTVLAVGSLALIVMGLSLRVAGRRRELTELASDDLSDKDS